MPAAHATTILALSHLRWDFVFQRPQQLLTRAASDGFSVLYVEEPVWEGAAFARRAFERQGVTVIQPIVPADCDGAAADAHAARVVRDLGDAVRGPLWLWLYTPMALPLAAGLRPDRTVFDKMDELSAFAFAPTDLVLRERQTFERADVVFTGGRAMFEAAHGRHLNLHCFPSSIDCAHFGRARLGGADPADQSLVPRPRIGFFGVIDERFDVALFAEVSSRRPAWQFVMLGPTAKIDPASLPRPANVHWLGGKSYAELPDYLAHWDVGWMPFAINASTRFISPTKTPEFLAAGLPVVSTPIIDVVRDYGDAGLVAIAGDAEATIAAIEAAQRPPAPGWRKAVDAKLSAGSWDQTWSAMRSLIERAPIRARESVPARETVDA